LGWRRTIAMIEGKPVSFRGPVDLTTAPRASGNTRALQDALRRRLNGGGYIRKVM
jgi:hypothetical protein